MTERTPVMTGAELNAEELHFRLAMLARVLTEQKLAIDTLIDNHAKLCQGLADLNAIAKHMAKEAEELDELEGLVKRLIADLQRREEGDE